MPLTFATNGRPYLEQYDTKSGIWFLDLRQPDNAPKALRGWMSPEGITELLDKDPFSDSDIAPFGRTCSLGIAQLLCIGLPANLAQLLVDQIACFRLGFDSLACGFGVGMIYRFLKTGRFRRILFLVDRTALGEQAADVFQEVKLEDLMTLDDIYNSKAGVAVSAIFTASKYSTTQRYLL